MAETKTPTLHWAQREQKVLIEFQMLNTKDAKVTLSEGLLSLECAVDATAYKLENLPLFAEIDEEESKWFRDDRKIAISLKKKAPEWWDTLSKDKSFKKLIKTTSSGARTTTRSTRATPPRGRRDGLWRDGRDGRWAACRGWAGWAGWT